VAFKDALLLVHATDTVWLQELQFLKADIMESIHRELGKNLLEDIKFKIGPV